MLSRSKIFLYFGIFLAALVIGAVFFSIFFLNGQFRYAGTLEATKIDLAARLPAAIDEVMVHEGDRVTEGQTLIILSCEDFKIDARLAQDDYYRNKQLLKNNFIAESDLDRYKTKMDDANTKVGWCTIVSPINGKVLSRYHEPSEWMIPGTKILTLANVRDIWAYIYVPQPLVAKLSLGMKLKGYIPELKNKEFDGEIIKISDEAEFTPKNVQTQNERERLIYGIKVSFLGSNMDEVLKPGMTIQVVLPK
ncbi:MAG: efflux RND transporter periplasmic adaptor subunit [Gammaproteobacteria bacterium]|nr:efflux RND transporter periplasmic adaptor subunit [Gammaproteobacteria bacterium]